MNSGRCNIPLLFCCLEIEDPLDSKLVTGACSWPALSSTPVWFGGARAIATGAARAGCDEISWALLFPKAASAALEG